jgi:hypothetical protein
VEWGDLLSQKANLKKKKNARETENNARIEDKRRDKTEIRSNVERKRERQSDLQSGERN